MDLGLTGSTAVVTGGSKGMGLAIATTFAGEGAKVAVMARGAEALDEAVAKVRVAGAPDAVGISVDMSDAESIAAGFQTVAQRWGELNSLVHTIGPGDGYFEDLDDAQWEETFALGTMSGVRSIRAALPMLRAAEWAIRCRAEMGAGLEVPLRERPAAGPDLAAAKRREAARHPGS